MATADRETAIRKIRPRDRDRDTTSGKITFVKSSRVYILYEPHTKCVHYMVEEARVLARITSKIKECIQYYGFTKATLQRCENEEIGAVLARECGRNRTL